MVGPVVILCVVVVLFVADQCLFCFPPSLSHCLKLQMNFLMCSHIVEFLCPRHFAYLRSSGTTGDNLFVEMVRRDRVSCRLETMDGVSAPTKDPSVTLLKAPPNSHMKCVVRCRGAWTPRQLEWSFRGADVVVVLEEPYVDEVMALAQKVCCRSLSFKGAPIRHLPSVFLYGNDKLTKLSLPLVIPSLQEVPSYFLQGCYALTEVDLGSLSAMHTINIHFMFSCCKLASIDLTPLQNVTVIEAMFLAGCKGLRSIDLSPLANVRVLHHGFLDRCKGLVVIDLNPINNVLPSTLRSFEGLLGVALAKDLRGKVLLPREAKYRPVDALAGILHEELNRPEPSPDSDDYY